MIVAVSLHKTHIRVVKIASQNSRGKLALPTPIHKTDSWADGSPCPLTQVVSAAFDCCLHTLLRHRCLFGDTKPDAVTSRLAGCLRRRVHDVNWEVRDSSLEFLTRLTGGLKGEGGSLKHHSTATFLFTMIHCDGSSDDIGQ